MPGARRQAFGTRQPAASDRDKIAAVMKPIARYMDEMGIGVAQLVAATGLDRKTVEAIVRGNFTSSPSQRQRLSAALGVSADEISWEHAVRVEHLRGNGPQAGRSS
jgi:transcriptional regulator with XRE-family HTH domain